MAADGIKVAEEVILLANTNSGPVAIGFLFRFVNVVLGNICIPLGMFKPMWVFVFGYLAGIGPSRMLQDWLPALHPRAQHDLERPGRAVLSV